MFYSVSKSKRIIKSNHRLRKIKLRASVCLSVCLPASLPVCLPLRLSVALPTSLPFCVSPSRLCLSVCVYLGNFHFVVVADLRSLDLKLSSSYDIFSLQMALNCQKLRLKSPGVKNAKVMRNDRRLAE